jgi:hypothetical protein
VDTTGAPTHPDSLIGVWSSVSGLSPRRRVLLATLCAVLLLALAAAVTAVVLRRSDHRAAPPQDRPGTVILVPGYGGGSGALDQLAGRIEAGGRIVRVLQLPGDGTGDLFAQAAALDGYVNSALDQGAPSVDLIGYSAGGVVVRLWVQRHGGTGKARRIITLGSPHHGARIAAAGAAAVPGACPTACQQLVPGSSLLRGLADPVPQPPQWLSLWTADDQTVTPPESARLGGAVNVELQSLCSTLRLSHSGLPNDPLVTRLVLAAIGVEPIASPAAGCVSS